MSQGIAIYVLYWKCIISLKFSAVIPGTNETNEYIVIMTMEEIIKIVNYMVYRSPEPKA